MKQLFVTLILALFAVPTFAVDVDSWFVGGNLDIINNAAAGSGGITGAGVLGGVQANKPGVSVVGSHATGNTYFGSFSGPGCGECGPAAITQTVGHSSAGGTGFTALGKGASGFAGYGAIAGSGGFSGFERGFELDVGGFASGGQFE